MSRIDATSLSTTYTPPKNSVKDFIEAYGLIQLVDCLGHLMLAGKTEGNSADIALFQQIAKVLGSSLENSLLPFEGNGSPSPVTLINQCVSEMQTGGEPTLGTIDCLDYDLALASAGGLPRGLPTLSKMEEHASTKLGPTKSDGDPLYLLAISAIAGTEPGGWQTDLNSWTTRSGKESLSETLARASTDGVEELLEQGGLQPTQSVMNELAPQMDLSSASAFGKEFSEDCSKIASMPPMSEIEKKWVDIVTTNSANSPVVAEVAHQCDVSKENADEELLSESMARSLASQTC